MSKYRYIGKPQKRKDAGQIVTGKAEFGDDIRIKDVLCAKILRSPYSHAEILNISTEKAEALTGVKAVITYKNAPPWKCGLPPHRLICDKKVRYVGDTVALVAAVTPEIAAQALRLIEVEYKVLPGVYNGKDALLPDAPQLYKEFPRNIFPPGSPFEHGGPPFYQMKMGDCEKAFEESDISAESEVSYDTLYFPGAPEAPIVIAKWESERDVTIWASAQHPGLMRANASTFMNCHVNVIVPNVGGSYGNKGSLNYMTLIACALAKEAGRPVKYVMTKNEQMLVFEQRMANTFKGRIGMSKEGLVTAIEGMWIVDTGASSDLGQGQMAEGLGELHLVMAKTKNWNIDSKLVATNRVPSGVVRGFGGQELKSCVLHAWTRAMKKMNLDPYVCLKKNMCTVGDHYYWRDGVIYENKYTDYTKCFETAANKFGWHEKWKGWQCPSAINGSKVKGVGVGIHMSAEPGADDSEAFVRLEFDGTATIHCCVPEIGTAQRLATVKMAAEVLDIPIENVKLQPTQTDINPAEFGLAGSRGTRTIGTAVSLAAKDAKNKLLKKAAEQLHVSIKELDTKDGYLYLKQKEGERIPWSAIVHPYNTISGYGHFKEDFHAPNCFITFIEAEVDMDTGKTNILKVVGASDIGQIIDPIQLKMQFHGSLGSAGLDTAQLEEHILDTNSGRILTGNLIDYKWRTFNELPSYDTIILESKWESHPYGAIGCGESTTGGVPAAALMAIENALGGIEINHYPATADVILKALGKA